MSVDVAFKEDSSRIKSGNNAENMALIPYLGLNLRNRVWTGKNP